MDITDILHPWIGSVQLGFYRFCTDKIQSIALADKLIPQEKRIIREQARVKNALLIAGLDKRVIDARIAIGAPPISRSSWLCHKTLSLRNLFHGR